MKGMIVEIYWPLGNDFIKATYIGHTSKRQ